MANEVRQIVTNVTYPDVPSILGSINSSYALAVVISNQTDRTNGNVFVWKNTGSANGGTVYAGSSGFWEMQHDRSYVDVKWFGAKGDWSGFGTGTVNNAAIQSALNYAAANGLDVYISAGQYRINASTAGSSGNALELDLTVLGRGRLLLYGAGPDASLLIYDDYPNVTAANINILKIISTTNVLISIENFGVAGFAEQYEIAPNTFIPIRSGTGLSLYKTYPLTVKNMYFAALNEGIHIDAVNNALFENCFTAYVRHGFIGETFNPSLNTLPNVLNFTTCQFIANDVRAVEISHAHLINFQSCDITSCGIANTPALTEVAAIDCTFNGKDGANGLNVNDCYFENNIGLADIRVQVQTNSPVFGQPNPYYGTHTFRGNTFNRNLDKKPPGTGNPIYTKHNILITGSGQTPKRLFGQNKCKLVFIGNGFFVNVPGSSNNYQPVNSRKAIEIQQYSDGAGVNYWEFDVVEEGNTYNGDPYGYDAPVFGLFGGSPYWGVDSRLMPQVSEFTRVKAFGSFNGDILDKPGGITLFDTWGYSYNVKNIVPATVEGFGAGAKGYNIIFANELKRMPTITATYVWQPQLILSPFALCAVFIANKATTGFTLVAVPIAGSPSFRNFKFDFQVF